MNADIEIQGLSRNRVEERANLIPHLCASAFIDVSSRMAVAALDFIGDEETG